VRARLGPLELGTLPVGHYLRLTEKDLQFVRDAEAMYLANKEAWDAEVPKRPQKLGPPLRRGFGKKGGGGRPFRGGGRPSGGPRSGGGGRPFPPRGPGRSGGGPRPPRGPGGFGGGGGYRGPGGGGPPRGPSGPGGPRPDDRPRRYYD